MDGGVLGGGMSLNLLDDVVCWFGLGKCFGHTDIPDIKV